MECLPTTREGQVELFTRLHALETALLHLISLSDEATPPVSWLPTETYTTRTGLEDIGDLALHVNSLLTNLWPTVDDLKTDECRGIMASSDLLAARLLATLPHYLDSIASHAEYLSRKGSQPAVAA